MPAVHQQFGIHLPEEVAKAMVFALLRPIGYSPQRGWLVLIRSCLSGTSFLCGLRMACQDVKTVGIRP